MLGYRKRSFANAHALLEVLRADLENLAALTDLQKLLCREIVRAELHIRKLKAELKGVQANTGSAKARRSSYLKNRIEALRHCVYVWRCFGDGIAFLYMDKFALKQTYYNVNNSNPKQASGFLAGKDGLAFEIMVLEKAIEQGVPALLVDLTNTIRYGDICLMTGPDPHLIEVKAGGKLDQRGKRQKRELEKLQSFFETDRAEDLRGAPKVLREAFGTPERSFVDEINECIAEAMKSGHAARNPEKGLHYVVLKKPNGVEILDSLKLKAPWACMLNEWKIARAWAPYLPYTVTIKNKDQLWAFIRGDIYVTVLVETDVLCEIAANKGYKATFEPGNDYPLRIKIPRLEETTGVSEQMLGRIGMEFVSPEWLVSASIEMLERGVDLAELEAGA